MRGMCSFLQKLASTVAIRTELITPTPRTPVAPFLPCAPTCAINLDVHSRSGTHTRLTGYKSCADATRTPNTPNMQEIKAFAQICKHTKWRYSSVGILHQHPSIRPSSSSISMLSAPAL